jgi:hypothetical protein
MMVISELAPPPADGPADPWFRPVSEDGDDDPLPSPPPARPAAQAPCRTASWELTADPSRIALRDPEVARRIAALCRGGVEFHYTR